MYFLFAQKDGFMVSDNCLVTCSLFLSSQSEIQVCSSVKNIYSAKCLDGFPKIQSPFIEYLKNFAKRDISFTFIHLYLK